MGNERGGDELVEEAGDDVVNAGVEVREHDGAGLWAVPVLVKSTETIDRSRRDRREREQESQVLVERHSIDDAVTDGEHDIQRAEGDVRESYKGNCTIEIRTQPDDDQWKETHDNREIERDPRSRGKAGTRRPEKPCGNQPLQQGVRDHDND